MFPKRWTRPTTWTRLPHASGGVSQFWNAYPLKEGVFPTRVGVFPGFYAGSALTRGLPHASGGVSRSVSPDAVDPQVFPTRVGVFLIGLVAGPDLEGLPHASGGVSAGARREPCSCGVFPTRVGVFLRGSGPSTRLVWSSPREWGCFSLHGVHQIAVDGLPHASGGVSPTVSGRRTGTLVFPTRVGVFPAGSGRARRCDSLPHASGGVSIIVCPSIVKVRSSPREWGCFCSIPAQTPEWTVFPTRVGVFPSPRFRGGGA